MPLLESNTLPPPTAKMKSTPSSLQIRIPSFTFESNGLATTPPHKQYAIFSSSNAFFTRSKRPDLIALCPP